MVLKYATSLAPSVANALSMETDSAPGIVETCGTCALKPSPYGLGAGISFATTTSDTAAGDPPLAYASSLRPPCSEGAKKKSSVNGSRTSWPWSASSATPPPKPTRESAGQPTGPRCSRTASVHVPAPPAWMPSPGGPYSVILVTGDGGAAAPDAKLAVIDRLVAAPSLSGVNASSTISASPAHAIPASHAHTHTSKTPASTQR